MGSSCSCRTNKDTSAPWERDEERAHMLATRPDELPGSNQLLKKDPEVTIAAAPEIDTKSSEVGEAKILNLLDDQEDPVLSGNFKKHPRADQPRLEVDCKNLNTELENIDLHYDVIWDRPRTPEPEPEFHAGIPVGEALSYTMSVKDGEDEEVLVELYYALKPADMLNQEDPSLDEEEAVNLRDSNEIVVDNPIADQVAEGLQDLKAISSQHLTETDSLVDGPTEEIPSIEVFPVQQQAQLSTEVLSDVPEPPDQESEEDTTVKHYDQQQGQVIAEDLEASYSDTNPNQETDEKASHQESDKKASVKAFGPQESEPNSLTIADIRDSNIDEID